MNRPMDSTPLPVAPPAPPKDPRRLVFVRKKWTGATGWSDAIRQFYLAAASEFATAAYVEVSIKGLAALRLANRALRDAALPPGTDPANVVVLVNHSICWWALWPTLMALKRQGATVCLCMHEHEHILGMSFVMKHLAHFKLKELLRYSRLFHGIPARKSSRVLVLSDAQASVLRIPDAVRTSYLPVDGRLFPADRTVRGGQQTAPAVLFAHDPARFDKGHRFLAPAQALTTLPMDITYGRSKDLPFDQVYTKYWNCDVLFLPSDWESFSLVFVEALACNKFIVTSNRVGALRLLTGKYSLDELALFGVFVSDHTPAAYARCLDQAAWRFGRGDVPTTRSLFEEFGFDGMQLPLGLL